MKILEELAYLEYVYEQVLNQNHLDYVENQLKLEQMISEDIYDSVLLTRYRVRYQSLNEANIMKFKESFNKFMTIMNNMFNQFIQYSSGTANKYKDYLVANKDIIIAKNPKENMPIEMRRYSEGIKRINMPLQPFDTVKVGITNPDDYKKCVQQTQKIMLPAYNDPKIPFKQFCKTYFQGGADKISTNLNALNFAELYDYCAGFESVISTIKSNIDTINKMNTNVDKVIKQAAVQQQQQQTAQQPANAVIATNASAKICSIVDSIFNEADNNGRMVVNKEVNKQNIMNQKQQISKAQKEAKANTDKDMNILNAYKNTAIAIIGSKMHAANVIYKDYITLMKYHTPNISLNIQQQQPQGQQQPVQQ